MHIITIDELRKKLEDLYQPNAFCWSQATDEVRDLCRHARETLGLDDSHAVNFRLLSTPSAWNTIGINGIITLYKQMNDNQKDIYIKNNKHLLGNNSPDD